MNCASNVRDELPENSHGRYPRLVTTNSTLRTSSSSKSSMITSTASSSSVGTEIRDRHHQHRTSHRLTSCLRGERDEAEGNLISSEDVE